VEQGLYKLKTDKQKELNTIKAESLATLVAYQSPLANSFVFNFFFLTLLNLFNNNTPISFP
jgi:hypothetical protein